MNRAREQMKTIEAELVRVREQLSKLQVEEALLLRLRASMSGETVHAVPAARKRATSVKPLILDIMHNVGTAGMTTAEVAALVKDKVPEVAKDTVGSVLSRLKSEGALTYVGEKYYEKQFKPQGMGFEAPLRAVS